MKKENSSESFLLLWFIALALSAYFNTIFSKELFFTETPILENSQGILRLSISTIISFVSFYKFWKESEEENTARKF